MDLLFLCNRFQKKLQFVIIGLKALQKCTEL